MIVYNWLNRNENIIVGCFLIYVLSFTACAQAEWGSIMATSYKRRLQLDRARLQNPYAHIEELELSPSPADHKTTRNSNSEPVINVARRQLEDPYAFLDGDGEFSAHDGSVKDFTQFANDASLPSNLQFQIRVRKAAGSYSDRDIESVARDLQLYVWQQRQALWPLDPPENPLDVLKIEVALSLVGYEYVEVEGLSNPSDIRGLNEVAGVIDPTSSKVFISNQQEESVKRFTGAHELGHAVLHDFQGAVHRDRPINGELKQKEPREKEADKFARYFLMPEKLLRKHFAARFGGAVFCLDEDSAFALGRELADLEKECGSSRDIALLLASTNTYNGKRFRSLAESFGVSRLAMAIRLEELSLI